ncbi:MAG: family 20 glycosylhydrolase [Verrucomicrobiae bacterium]
MLTKPIYWLGQDTPAELHSMLTAVGEAYPVVQGQGRDGVRVSFIRSDHSGRSAVSMESGGATVRYGSVSGAARAIGTLLSGLESEEGTVFRSLGIMLDCSRNAVMTVAHFKKWLRQLALMGYNQAMLYTEDTYRLPDEPYFGYMRGAYTEDELREIDAYAASLGIEMIACIQTLGHLQQILRWGPYHGVKDTDCVLRVDADGTYQLIEKMIALWSRVFGSRRIHVGMDETHDLGRGLFMDQFGYERAFEIFNRHLARVVEICEAHQLKPMIWSDMYFRLSNKSLDYYDPNGVIPDEVKAKIPKSVELVYWDYYHKEKGFYLDWIRRHRDLGHEPLMASGLWTWSRLWYDHRRSIATVRPCIEACVEEKVQELIFTIWGDDGANCEFDSVLAGLCKASELAYGCDCDGVAAQKFEAICSGRYKNYIALGAIQYPGDVHTIPGPLQLWDDPLLGINWNNMALVNPGWVDLCLKNYRKLLSDLELPEEDNRNASVSHGKLAVEVLILKLEFRRDLLKAYSERNEADLKVIAGARVPEIAEAVRRLLRSFRTQWMRRNKPFGFEVIQLRLNSQIGRYEEIAVRINELLDRTIRSIEELDEPAPALYAGESATRLASGSINIV